MDTVNAIKTISNSQFQAPWPTHLDPDHLSTCEKTEKLFFDFLSLLLFPFHSLANNLVHPAAKNNLNDAYTAHLSLKQYLEHNRAHLSADLNGEEVHFSTPDGRVLNGMFFPGTQSDKVILLRFGNGVHYENAQQEIKFYLKSGTSVFTYNPGGVGESEGHSHPLTLAIDCYTAFEFLVKAGIDPNKILLIGHSLGGAETACGGAVIQKHYEKEAEKNKQPLTVFVNAINDRSLKSTRAYAAALGEEFDKELSETSYSGLAINLWNCMTECNLLDAFLVLLFLVIVKPLSDLFGLSCAFPFVMPLIDWEMDCKGAFDQLKGKKCVISHPLDHVITTSVQMYHDFTEEEKKEVVFIQLEGSTKTQDHHNRAFYVKEEKRILDVVKQFLKIEESDYSIYDKDVEVI